MIEGWNLNLYLKKKITKSIWKQVNSCYAEIWVPFRFLLFSHISESLKIRFVFLSTALVLQNVFFSSLFLSISINYWDTTGFVCFFPFETTVHILEVQSVGFLFMYLFHSSLIYFNCWYLSCQTVDITCFIYDIFQLKVMLLYVDVNIDLVFCNLGLWSLLSPRFLTVNSS